jgi:hypothetical protein
LTRFIGREREIATIQRMLVDNFPLASESTLPFLGRGRPDRLVTITGVGGSGKTRLAIEAAHHLLAIRPSSEHPFSDGIWFISLASLADRR